MKNPFFKTAHEGVNIKGRALNLLRGPACIIDGIVITISLGYLSTDFNVKVIMMVMNERLKR